jgi:hypothetical protein
MKTRLPAFRGIVAALIVTGSLTDSPSMAQEPPEEPPPDEQQAGEEESAAETKGAIGKVRGRILPAPFVITEPAIGKGLGLGFIYFHGRDAVERPRVQSASAVGNTARRGKPPPTATAAGGFYTDNETRGIAIGHTRSMADDRYRIVGLLASMEVNATYYEGNAGFDFGLDAKAIYGRGQRRIGASNLFLGMSFGWMDGSIGFDVAAGTSIPDDVLASDFTNNGIALSAIHDSLDDSMMPGSGHLYDLTVWRFDDLVGSDFDYTKSQLKLLWFRELVEEFHLGLRLEIANVSGDAPFFMEPFVPLRGIPALRYQADTAGAVEIEGRYDISPRWAAVAFAGAGLIDWDPGADEDDDDIYTYGAGIRFQLFTEQNVWIGLDIAQGPEESNWYIQIGHPW